MTTCTYNNCKDKAYSPERFRELVKEFEAQEEAILDWKAEEYSSGEDRLQNFREIALFLDCQPEDVVLMYLLKHIQSIALAVREGNYLWAWETEGREGLKQRVADARNYLLLLAAALDEKEDMRQESMERELRRLGLEEMPMAGERGGKQ